MRPLDHCLASWAPPPTTVPGQVKELLSLDIFGAFTTAMALPPTMATCGAPARRAVQFIGPPRHDRRNKRGAGRVPAVDRIGRRLFQDKKNVPLDEIPTQC